jgi:hypothetical protein
MKIIKHRCNTLDKLLATNLNYGVEVDIRSFGKKLIMHHDPFVEGESFEDWINFYQHETLILNVKEEGLESRLIEIMAKKRIENYFFLDQSFPFLVKWATQSKHRCAVRISEFESVETALSLSGKVNWIWVDCFTHFPLTHLDAQRLKKAGFKLCLVSPELQGRDAKKEITLLVNILNERNISADAVCTKYPAIWENFIDLKKFNKVIS